MLRKQSSKENNAEDRGGVTPFKIDFIKHNKEKVVALGTNSYY